MPETCGIYLKLSTVTQYTPRLLEINVVSAASSPVGNRITSHAPIYSAADYAPLPSLLAAMTSHSSHHSPIPQLDVPDYGITAAIDNSKAGQKYH